MKVKTNFKTYNQLDNMTFKQKSINNEIQDILNYKRHNIVTIIIFNKENIHHLFLITKYN